MKAITTRSGVAYEGPSIPTNPSPKSDITSPLFNEIIRGMYESEDSMVSNSDKPVLLNTPLFDEDECFDPGGDIDEIDVFLAIDVPSDIMDAYNDLVCGVVALRIFA
ncbi:hypothetical protein Tco_1006610 [Tanacetum coccineum]|uniref:Uncharacterized protein n=1 Tax=Tanacetum coccineum TaxID=301880 RepID=A0ABQ5FIC0_9ASTR